MTLSTSPQESAESAEQDSTKKLVFWMGNSLEPRAEDQVGYIVIKSGKVEFHAQSEDDYNFLTRKVEAMWQPQRGVPRFRKTSSGEYEKDSDGKVVILDHVFPGNASADAVLQAMHEYNQILGVTGSRLEDL